MFFSLRHGERETSVEWHRLHDVTSSKKTDKPSTSTELSQAKQTAVHRTKQSVSFLPDFLCHVLHLVKAGLKECQALYKAAIICDKRKLGVDARILKILILQSFTEKQKSPKAAGLTCKVTWEKQPVGEGQLKYEKAWTKWCAHLPC